MTTGMYPPPVSGQNVPAPPFLDSETREPEREVSLLELLAVLAEHKRTIMLVVAAFTTIAFLISLLLPKRYSATTVILPPQQSSSISSAVSSQLESLGGVAALAGGSLGIKNPNDLQVALLKSRTIEDAMIQHFNLMGEYRDRYLSDARKTLERNVTINGSDKDGLIRITVADYSPARAAELANGYVAQFRALSENLAITEASQRRLFFEQQLQSTKDQLAGAEEALKDTEQKTGMIQLDSQARALIESAASLRAQIAAKEVQIQSMQTYENGQNADLVQARQELDGLREQLAKLGGAQSGDGELIMPKGAVPQAGLEYVRRLRDVKYYETIFDILARQYELAKLDEAKQGALIQVVDVAVLPDKKTSPHRTIIIVCSTLAGLISGILLVFFQIALEGLHVDPAQAELLQRIRNALWIRRT